MAALFLSETIMKNDNVYLELAAYALGYSEDEYILLSESMTFELDLRIEILSKLGVSIECFSNVANALLPLSPIVNTELRMQQAHVFVTTATHNGDCRVVLSKAAQNKKALLIW